MKAITLILALAGAVSLSSCCCQSQPMPKLRPVPKCTTVVDDGAAATAPTEPTKVIATPAGK